MVSPEVISSAAAAPVKGHGLGSTIWKGCVWQWQVIKCFLGGTGLVVVQTRRLEL